MRSPADKLQTDWGRVCLRISGQVCRGEKRDLFFHSLHTYFCHFVCEQPIATPWMPSRRDYLKICANYLRLIWILSCVPPLYDSRFFTNYFLLNIIWPVKSYHSTVMLLSIYRSWFKNEKSNQSYRVKHPKGFRHSCKVWKEFVIIIHKAITVYGFHEF